MPEQKKPARWGMPEWMARLPRCAWGGKIAHPDRSSAERHLRRMARQGCAAGVEAYHCAACKCWHIGRWTPQEKRSRP